MKLISAHENKSRLNAGVKHTGPAVVRSFGLYFGFYFSYRFTGSPPGAGLSGGP